MFSQCLCPALALSIGAERLGSDEGERGVRREGAQTEGARVFVVYVAKGKGKKRKEEQQRGKSGRGHAFGEYTIR